MPRANEYNRATDVRKPAAPSLLLDRIVAVLGAEWVGGEWLARCPAHADAAPSMTFRVGEVYPVVVRCHAGCSTEDIATALGLTVGDLCAGTGEPRAPADYDRRPAGRSAVVHPPVKLSEAVVKGRASRLQADPAALALLHKLRGLTATTAARYSIGWDDGDGRCEWFDVSRPGRFSIPVRDRAGKLVNLKQPGEPPDRDLHGLPGHPTSLYLADDVPHEQGWALLCEGELDCLLARQHGLPAVTSTGGAGTWKPEWNQYFRGLHVAVVLDCDDPGREGAARRAEALAGVAAAVRVVDLGLGDGEDLGDWLLRHGRSAADLRRLIREARP